MSNKGLYHSAGWCALLFVVLTVVAYLLQVQAGELNTPAAVLIVVGTLLFLPVFYALSVVYRSESSILSLLGLILVVPPVALTIASIIDDESVFLYAVSGLVLAFPVLVFFYLAYRSAKMPRGLVWLKLLAGVFLLMAGAFSFGGATDPQAWISTISAVLFWVWMVWLWRWFRSDKPTLA